MFRITIEQDERYGLALGGPGAQNVQIVGQAAGVGSGIGTAGAMPSQVLSAGGPPSFLHQQMVGRSFGGRRQAKPPEAVSAGRTAAAVNVGPAPEWLRKKAMVMTPTLRKGKIPVA